VRTLGVVFDAPGLDDPSGLSHRDQPVFVQTLVAELAVEALDVCVLIGPAGPDERQLHAALVSAGIEHLAFELWSMIHGDRLRQAALIS
jgi:hypothetical protein